MRSMTGFGLGEATLRAGRVSTEVRSLNHRFLDLRVRLPSEIADQTFFVEQLCRERLGRGRYDVSVRIDAEAMPPLKLDIERARSVYAALEGLRDELCPDSDVSLSLLGSFPGLMVGPGVQDPELLQRALAESIRLALDNLDQMRSAEGAALAAELSTRLDSVRSLLRLFIEQAPALVLAQEKRLTQRLERLLGGAGTLDSARLAMEVALLADRCDITEELVRLSSHFDQFQSFLDASSPSGRKLDFLLQEMGRETNTIGAKCQDASLAHLVVSLKAEVERLREQVQNVE
jgi:uncharacterized protein (TIGR00255 family)